MECNSFVFFAASNQHRLVWGEHSIDEVFTRLVRGVWYQGSQDLAGYLTPNSVLQHGGRFTDNPIVITRGT